MPGFGHEMAAHGSSQQVDIGKQMEVFINSALLDFTHMAVLMYLVREVKAGASTGDIAKVVGDPKRVVQKVLNRFQDLGMVRVSGGLLGKKYNYEREGPRAHFVSKLLKLWEHPQAHSVILRKILAPKS